MDQTNPNNSMNIILKKYKVVMLGDQSVGKTSIIKAYSDEGFNPDNDVGLSDAADHRYRLQDAHREAGQQADQAAAVGHCRPREVQESDTFLH